MATDLAKLVVSLEAQTTKYIQELDRANTKLSRFQRDQESKLNAISEGFKAFGKAVASGLSIAAFEKFIDSLDRLQESAKAAGVGAEAFQAWGFAAKKAGIDSESFASGMARANKVIGDAANGSAEASDLFARLGVSIYDVNGNVRSAESIVRDFADAIAKTESPAQRAAASAQLFGRELGPKFVAVLADGSAGLRDVTEEAKRMGLVISNEALDAADKFNDSIDTLATVALANLANTFGGLIPSLTEFVNKMGSAAQSIGSFFQTAEAEIEKHPVLMKFLEGAASGGIIGAIAAGASEAISPEKPVYGGGGIIDRSGADLSKIPGNLGRNPRIVDNGVPEAPAAPPGLTIAQQKDAAARAKALEKRIEEEQKAADRIAKYNEDTVQTYLRNSERDFEEQSKKREDEEKALSEALGRQALDALKRANDQAQAFGDLFAQNLVQAADGGFDAVLRSWALTLEQMVLKAEAANLFRALFPQGFSASSGGIVGSIASFLGFRAEGGPVMPGGSYIVGERGPELFTPHAAGTITPNNKLGGSVVYNIDARQAQNPAATAAAVRLAVAQSNAQMHDAKRRGRG